MGLVEHTRKLLRARPAVQTLSEVAAATGLEYHWLTAVSKGRLKSYDCDRIQRLYVWLTGDVARFDF